MIAATLARPVGGWLSDRFGAYPVLVLVFAGVAIDAAVLATLAPAPRIVPVSIACLTLGAFLGAGNGAVFKLVPAGVPGQRRRGRRHRRRRGRSRRLLPAGLRRPRQGRRGHVHLRIRRPARLRRRLPGDRRLAAANAHRRRSCAACRTSAPRVPDAASLLRASAGRTAGARSRATAASGSRSTATAGSTTGSSARRTASTARARARGRSTSRTGSSPGRRSRPTTRRTAPTSPSTSRAAARAAPRSAGTSTRRCACATRTSAACCSSCTARRSRATGDPVEAWATIVEDPEKARALQVAARQGRLRPRLVGRGRRPDRRRARAHDPPLRARTASPASRRSRRCRWSRTRPARGSCR